MSEEKHYLFVLHSKTHKKKAVRYLIRKKKTQLALAIFESHSKYECQDQQIFKSKIHQE